MLAPGFFVHTVFAKALKKNQINMFSAAELLAHSTFPPCKAEDNKHAKMWHLGTKTRNQPHICVSENTDPSPFELFHPKASAEVSQSVCLMGSISEALISRYQGQSKGAHETQNGP